MHDSEPDCAVRQEVEQGRICAERYENYRKLLKELKDREENRYR
jgi:ribosome biogenesis GTPase